MDYRGARFYDSDLARFLSLDPHDFIYPDWSPFHYVARNPLLFTDPTGMDWYENEKSGEVYWTEGNAKIEGSRHIGPTYRFEGPRHTIIYNQLDIIGIFATSEVKDSDIYIIHGGTRAITKQELFFEAYYNDAFRDVLYKKLDDDVQKELFRYVNYHKKTKSAAILGGTFGVLVTGTVATGVLLGGGTSAGAAWTQPISIFWTGGEKAAVAAKEFALAIGGRTLGQGISSRFIQRMTYEVLQRWSASFAQNAYGKVHVFVSASGARRGSIFLKNELPVLLEKGIEVIFHVVP